MLLMISNLFYKLWLIDIYKWLFYFTVIMGGYITTIYKIIIASYYYCTWPWGLASKVKSIIFKLNSHHNKYYRLQFISAFAFILSWLGFELLMGTYFTYKWLGYIMIKFTLQHDLACYHMTWTYNYNITLFSITNHIATHLQFHIYKRLGFLYI